MPLTPGHRGVVGQTTKSVARRKDKGILRKERVSTGKVRTERQLDACQLTDYRGDGCQDVATFLEARGRHMDPCVPSPGSAFFSNWLQ